MAMYRGFVPTWVRLGPWNIITVRTEGVMAMYKGFVPTWVRLGPWNIIFFMTYEQMKKIY